MAEPSDTWRRWQEFAEDYINPDPGPMRRRMESTFQSKVMGEWAPQTDRCEVHSRDEQCPEIATWVLLTEDREELARVCDRCVTTVDRMLSKRYGIVRRGRLDSWKRSLDKKP